MADTNKKALIYCRVSDVKQTTEGNGLDSQQFRCEKYAVEKSYELAAVYRDVFTGGGDYAKRPGMTALLQHLRKDRKSTYVIVIDDLMRLGRDTRYYLELKDKIRSYNATVECLNYVFDASPEGEFHEEINVSAGKMYRRQMARQTLQKTKARLEAGYHAFIAPAGFKYVLTKEQGNILVRDEPVASVIAEMMEGFASGRFQTKTEARRFLELSPDFPKGKSGKIGNNQAHNILSNPLYAGYIQYKPWGVSLRKGKHDGMVSYETFCKIQERMKGRAHAPARRDVNRLFPLRGSILCECGNALTAAPSRSATGRDYLYYVCQNRKCEHKGKSIRKDVLEGEFERLLKTITPAEPLVGAAKRIFKNTWEKFRKTEALRADQYRDQIKTIDAEIESLLDTIVKVDRETVIKDLESRIEKKEEEKLLIEAKMRDKGRSKRPFNEMYRTAIDFLLDPHKLWACGQFEGKRTVVKLAFADRLTWDRKGLYRTPELSLPFRVLGDFFTHQMQMVPGAGLEPARGSPLEGF